MRKNLNLGEDSCFKLHTQKLPPPATFKCAHSLACSYMGSLGSIPLGNFRRQCITHLTVKQNERQGSMGINPTLSICHWLKGASN